MKKTEIKEEETKTRSVENPNQETDLDGNQTSGDEGEDNGSDDLDDDDVNTRPNRGTGTTGPKNPIGGGNKGQYSLRNNNE